MSTTSPQRCDVKMTQRPRSRSARTMAEEPLDLAPGQSRGGLVEEEDLAARAGARARSRAPAAGRAGAPRRARAGRSARRRARRGSRRPAPGARAAGSVAAARAAPCRSGGSRPPSSTASASAPGRRSRPRAPARRAGRERSTSSPLIRTTPSSGLQDAREDLDHRALAGAVLADERVHLAEVGGERRVVQRMHAAERLRDAGRLDRSRRPAIPVVRAESGDGLGHDRAATSRRPGGSPRGR